MIRSGETYGRVTVIDPAGTFDKSGSKMWRLRCECGTEFLRTQGQVRRGFGCGCNFKPMINLAGQVFGLWTVLRRDESATRAKGNQASWVCRCACGTERSLRGQNLREGRSTTCGCVGRAKTRAERLAAWAATREAEKDGIR